jgi:hypothetical protein
MIEFGVEVTPVRLARGWQLEGRCWTDIKVGDVFTELVPLDCHWDSTGNPHTIFGRVQPVQLVVIRIRAYGQDHQCWYTGSTAVLEVSGTGVPEERSVLRAE